MRRLTLALLVVATTIALGFAGLRLWNTPDWPEFPEADSNVPQTVYKVDQDYAYHIGDLLEVDLFINQKPDTEVMPGSLSVDGDFELAAKPSIKTKELEDGTVVYLLNLKLQSFEAKEELAIAGAVTWKDGEETHQLNIEAFKIYWSRTWDGRKEIMQGDDPRVSAYWIGSRFVMPLAIASILYLTLLTLAIRTWIRTPRPVNRKAAAMKRAAEILDSIREGNCTKDGHVELNGLIRKNWGIGPVPADKLTDEMVSTREVIEFLRLSDVAIYSDSGLDEKETMRANELGKRILNAW